MTGGTTSLVGLGGVIEGALTGEDVAPRLGVDRIVERPRDFDSKLGYLDPNDLDPRLAG